MLGLFNLFMQPKSCRMVVMVCVAQAAPLGPSDDLRQDRER